LRRLVTQEVAAVAILPATQQTASGFERTEAAFVDALRRRDTQAWAALFEREHPLVFRAVLAQVANRTVAEDITAQVFLEAIEGIARYRDRGRPIRAWLLAIARHRSIDWFRKRRREWGTVVEPATEGPDEALTLALAALDGLTPEQREVVHLRFVEGYSLEEVAGLTGRSTGAVKAMQHRAVARMRVLVRREAAWRT
jgi:RNA polymerase sigma-70 factor (ECF subfamily)